MQYISNTKEFHIEEPTVVSIGKFDGLHCGHKKLVAEMIPLTIIAAFIFCLSAWYSGKTEL